MDITGYLLHAISQWLRWPCMLQAAGGRPLLGILVGFVLSAAVLFGLEGLREGAAEGKGAGPMAEGVGPRMAPADDTATEELVRRPAGRRPRPPSWTGLLPPLPLWLTGGAGEGWAGPGQG